MKLDQFTEEPQDDPLQLAGDVALSAIGGALRGFGITTEDYSVVITIESGEKMATVIHLPGDDKRDAAVAAFEMQLLHVMASARALGVTVRVVGQG